MNLQTLNRSSAAGIGLLIVSVIFAVLTLALKLLVSAPAIDADRAAARYKALGEIRAVEETSLNSAGWVDRDEQTFRIPIEQAMRAVAAEGIAGWPGSPEPVATSRAPIADNHSPVAAHSAAAPAQAPVRRHRTERVSRLGSR